MYLRELSITHLRAFASTRLPFIVPRGKVSGDQLPNVTILLGNNGAGKSTVLKAIALAILGPVLPGSGYVPYSLVRREPGGRAPKAATASAELLLHRQDTGGTADTVKKASFRTEVRSEGRDENIYPLTRLSRLQQNQLTDHDSPAFFLLGYGATRRVEPSDKFDSATRARTQRPRFQRVSGIFEEATTLSPLTSFLPQLEKSSRSRYREALALLAALLPPPVRFTGVMEHGEYLFEISNGMTVPFPALSDGFRSYTGWVGDMLRHLCLCCPPGMKLADMRGIVMVDEVDLHLHPAWQRRVIPVLAQALPQMQFIFTTHSPIVTGTVRPENLIVMAGSSASGASAVQPSEDVHGHTADEILLSNYFGLPTTRALTVSRAVNRLAREAETKPRAALEIIRRFSKNAPPDHLRPDAVTPRAVKK